MMQIEYENNLRDLFSFSFYHVLRRRVIQLMLLIIAVINYNSVYKLDTTPMIKMFMFLMLSVITFGFVGIVMTISNYVTYRKSKNKNLYAKHNVELTDDGLVVQTQYSNMSYSWKALVRIVQNKRLIMIYVQNNAAVLVPKRIFDKEEEVVSLFKYAASAWEAARV